MSWGNAEAHCEGHGAHLASIHSEEENNFLLSISDQAVLWLGGGDFSHEGAWVWSDGSAWNFTNWEKGMPDDFVGLENCLRWNSDGTWNDVVCPLLDVWPLAKKFVCKREM